MFENGQPKKLKVVMGHAVESITVVEDADAEERKQLERLFVPAREKLSAAELKSRRDKLRSWLQVSRFPVRESPEEPDVLLISEAVRLMPPYGPEDCQCTNPVVLGKIRGLIASMPADAESWTSPYEPVH